MFKDALFLSTILMLAAGLFLLGECRFLVPYREALIHRYGAIILGFTATLFVNLCTGIYAILQVVRLGDMGRKLRHVERQIARDGSISSELSRMLER